MNRLTQVTAAIAAVLFALPALPAGAQSELRPIETERFRQQLPQREHPKSEECPIPTVVADPEADCADWQWIGVLEEPAKRLRVEELRGERESDGKGGGETAGGDWVCPDAGPGWSVRHLFCPDDGPASGLAAPAHPLPADCDPAELAPGLRPFCLYRHQDAGEDLAARGLPGMAALGRDCAVIGPMAGELAGELVRATLTQRERHFLDQAGAKPAPPADALVTPPTTRVAVVDTSPTSTRGDRVEPRSPHGRSLDTMAERLQGRPGAGGVEVTERLALAYVRFDPRSRELSLRDEVRGGFFGTFADLARAIHQEVRQAGELDLVLNLSLGWQRVHGGLEANVEAMPAAVQAVHRALADAQCRGALTVAAAGNRTWGPDLEANRGALLPGAWESRPATTAARCADLVAAGEVALTNGGGYRPFLFAAGGVEADGRPLGNSRAAFGGEPPRVAFAEHAVVGRPDDAGEPTAVLTGSSVAAAIVSAAAAAAWAGDEDLDAFAVMDRVWEESARDPLRRSAGLCLGEDDAPCPGVRRVRVQPASKTTAAGGARRAVAPLRLDSSPNPAFENAVVLDGRRFHRLPASDHGDCPPPEFADALRRAPGEHPVERWRNVGGDPAAALYRCPRWQLPAVDSRPASAPQPETNGCTSCGFEQNSPGTVYLEIDPQVLGRLSNPVLYVGGNAYSLPIDLNRNPRLKIVNVEAGDGDRVYLSVVIDGTRSATAPLLRVRKR